MTARPREPDLAAVLRPERPTLEVAAAILGWHLVRDDGDEAGLRVGRIVEVEAYIGEEDRASHARFGRTARNAVMYGLPGQAYVYLVYGMHDCLNIVTEPAGRPAALLVRAVEPILGVERMRAARAHRANARRKPVMRGANPGEGTAEPRARVPNVRLGAGPGLVCAAFDLDRTLTGLDLLDPASPVRLEPPPSGEPAPVIVASPRVGIGYAGDPWSSLPWRFSIAGNPAVSSKPPAPLSSDR